MYVITNSRQQFPAVKGCFFSIVKKDPGGKWNIATELISRAMRCIRQVLCGNICNIGLLRKEINYENKELVRSSR
jgi:hypothetical protein